MEKLTCVVGEPAFPISTISEQPNHVLVDVDMVRCGALTSGIAPAYTAQPSNVMNSLLSMGRIYLWTDGRAGLAQPIHPSQLKAADSGWRDTLERWGPWIPTQGNKEAAVAAGWQSEQDVPGAPILLTGPASSSLDCAWYWLQAGAFPPGASVLSLYQWAGRGQFGRSWVSPVGNLYAAWRVPERAAEVEGLALALRMGYAVVQVLTELGLPVLLKWPNDVVLDGTKVAGLLCEQRGKVVMVGLGINLVSSPHRDDLREDTVVPAGSLRQWGIGISPLDLWLRVRSVAEACLERPPPVAALERLLAYRGRWVEVRAGGGPAFSGRVLGVTSQGALRVATHSGERQLFSASILSLGALDTPPTGFPTLQR